MFRLPPTVWEGPCIAVWVIDSLHAAFVRFVNIPDRDTRSLPSDKEAPPLTTKWHSRSPASPFKRAVPYSPVPGYFTGLTYGYNDRFNP